MTTSLLKTINARPVSNTFRILQILFLILAQVGGAAFYNVGPAYAAGISIIDDGGSNDPNGDGQNDLTRLTGDDLATPAFFEVSWSWDEPTTIKGGNASNACAMFDTDGDGFVNYSFCVEVSWTAQAGYFITNSGSGTDSVKDFPAWIECSDAKDDRCTQPTRLADPYTTPPVAATCSIVEANTDPFGPTAQTPGTPGGAGDDYPTDLTVTCSIDATLIPAGPPPAKFINVCSYPSAGNDGNNNPFDCVVTPGSGFLTIVKIANPSDTTAFTFNASTASTNGASSWSINGSGSVQLIPYSPTTTLDLNEAVPSGWKLDSASCVIQSSPTAGTGTSDAPPAQTGPISKGVQNLTIKSGLETICTFTDSVAFVPNPSLSLVKTASPTTYSAAGNIISYSYLVTNTGNTTFAGPVTVADDKATVTCPAGGLAPLASTTCTASYTITQADLDSGSVTNIAKASANGTDSNVDSETVNATQTKSLSLVKTASPATYSAVGDVISYSYKVTNTGNTTFAGPVTVADNKATVTCPAGGLAPGASTTCSASYTITQADLDSGSVTNTALASANGIDSNEDSETVTATQTRTLSLDKTASPSTYDSVGDVISYSYLVTNTGNVTLAGPVTVADDKATVTCPAGGLLPGAFTTCTASYTITQADLDSGSVTNTAKASANGIDSNEDSETVTATQTRTLSLDKTASPSTYDSVGDVISYSYLVTNTGNVTLAGPVTVADDKATVTCPAGGLAPLASTTCTASYTITQTDLDSGSVTNTAMASANGIDSNEDSEIVTAEQIRTLSLDKTASPSTYDSVGDVISYSYLVTNTGNVTLAGPVTVVDNNATVTCPAGGLAPLASTTCTASYTITQADLDSGAVTNTAMASANGIDSNEDSETVTATQTRTLSLDKIADPMTYDSVGDVINYSYLVTNNGNVTLRGPFTVSDDKTTATCPATSSLAPTASITCTAGYTITQADLDSGSVINVASASGSFNNQPVTSPTDTETVTAVQSPALTIVKSATPATYSTVGTTISYSYKVTNSGNVTLSGPFTVSDDKVSNESCPATASLAPGASITCTASYTITQADLDSGSVTNVASASGSFNNQPVTSPTDTETVTAVQSPALTIDKTATPATYSTVGTIINYSYKVTNSGNVTLSGPFTVSDDKVSNESCPSTASLAPGAFITCTASYTITQADLDSGSVTNVASASGSFNNQPVTSPTDTETVTAVQSPALSLTKSASPTTYSFPGQVIVYTYVVKNTGNVTLSGPFVITDDKLGTITCQATATPTLAPSASITCTKNYTIQASDLNATNNASIINHATATGKFGNNTVTSNQAQATINQVAGTSKITPTATTCQQYRDGTAQDYTELFYNVSKGKIGSVSPGVIFYYSTITAPSSSFTLNFTQFNSLNWKAMGIQQVVLWDSNCVKVQTVTTSINRQTGNVTITVTGATPGATYYLSVKPDPGSLVGTPVTVPYPTANYTFYTSVNGTAILTSWDGIAIKPK